tara:strand:- start:1744 stop:2163 length:420 start_codon:yes stop_codon:yes gene_type:complete
MAPRDALNCDLLLVDDDPLVVTLLETVIAKRAGLTVQAFATLDEAVPPLRSAASSQRGTLPKAIIVDWNLRKRTAREFISWVRMSSTMGHLPIYAISASDDDRLVKQAIEAGATEFCAKSAILSRIEAWTSKISSAAAG